jgi:hypothetical protein
MIVSSDHSDRQVNLPQRARGNRNKTTIESAPRLIYPTVDQGASALGLFQKADEPSEDAPRTNYKLLTN